MATVAEVDALAASLTRAMRHVVLRCSDSIDWTLAERYVTWPREWPDVVANCRYANFNGTIRALERRGIVEIEEEARRWHAVRLTRLGIRVQAALRLEDMNA